LALKHWLHACAPRSRTCTNSMTTKKIRSMLYTGKGTRHPALDSKNTLSPFQR
jgi:hypothetical protein